MVHQHLDAAQMISVQFDLFAACFRFRPFFCWKKWVILLIQLFRFRENLENAQNTQISTGRLINCLYGLCLRCRSRWVAASENALIFYTLVFRSFLKFFLSLFYSWSSMKLLPFQYFEFFSVFQDCNVFLCEGNYLTGSKVFEKMDKNSVRLVSVNYPEVYLQL